MNRLFIVGASVLQLPAIQKAKDMGLYVGVADYDPNAVGIAYADEYYNVSTIDEQGVYEAAKAFGADGIMTLATDMPMRSVAYTCEQLGLPGISTATALKATDKGEMIRAFEAAGVEHPWYYLVDGTSDADFVSQNITFPCIAKPVDNSGSRGVILVNTPEELETALAYSTKNGRGGGVIVEEYMQGQEVSVEIVVYNGVVHILQVTDKITTGAPHFVEIGHTQPSRLSRDDLEKIRDLARRAVTAIGIDNSPAHVEIMLTENGPKMVELGARMGGGCITTHLVPMSTGIDMIKATIDIALGKQPELAPNASLGAAIRFFFADHDGTLTAIDNADNVSTLPEVKQLTFTKKIGENICRLTSGADRIGFVITQGDDADEAARLCDNAHNLIEITIA